LARPAACSGILDPQLSPLVRPHTRALATRVQAPRSSVNGRITNVCSCHLHDPPAIHHPAVQFISLGDLDPTSLRLRCRSHSFRYLGPPRLLRTLAKRRTHSSSRCLLQILISFPSDLIPI